MTTPRLALSELLQNQSQPHVSVNNTLRRLDALVQAVALSIVTELPGSVVEGDSYLVASAGTTGALVGKEDNFIYYYGGWQYIEPFDGFRVYVIDTGTEYIYSLTNSPPGWDAFSGGGVVGIGDFPTFAHQAAGNIGVAEDNYNGGTWNHGNSINRLLLTPNVGDSIVTGLSASGTVDGQMVLLCNEHAARTITLPNANGGSLAANQWTGPGGDDIVLVGKQVIKVTRVNGAWRFS
jgi:hypothetical protein